MIGVLTWIRLIPPILLLVQNKPEDLGLRPDGASQVGRCKTMFADYYYHMDLRCCAQQCKAQLLVNVSAHGSSTDGCGRKRARPARDDAQGHSTAGPECRLMAR